MKDLEWKDEYSVGIPALDFQHRHIFDCLVTIAQGPTDDDKLRAEAEIIKLLNLLQEHFSLEESMMQSLHYPEIVRHTEEHRRFHADVRDLAQKSLRNKGGVSHEAIEVTHRWLREHIMTTDRHYLSFFSDLTQKPDAQ